MKLPISILAGFLFLVSAVLGGNEKYLKVTPQSGEGAYALLRRYNLSTISCNINKFKEINGLKNLSLLKGKDYKLPITVYKYNGKSIRSTIGNYDLDLAKRIQAYNEKARSDGLRKKDYRDDNVLWVPWEYINCKGKGQVAATPSNKKYPIFGKENEEVEIKDKKLKGCVYYIVSGHGGPDPGAMGKYNGKTITEDEYAYDIALRLAKDLLEHSATVYMIIRDPDDGIRDGKILKPDKDEVCYKNQKIPLNQIKRLNQRVNAINKLYAKHKKSGVRKQRVVILHVDSRGTGQRVDMFFYYNGRSKTGKNLATLLMNTVKEKYSKHQSGRGYYGTVKARNLHLLRKTKPPAVFIELGNIRNSRDQKRFVIEDNRQAVANWLTEGLLREK
jgi:N-acetylmuramoyl-L-alanine amidase